MMSALWASKTGMEAQDTALRITSNNLANVATVGFKKDRGVFQDLVYQIQKQPGGQTSQDTQLPSGLQLGTGVRVAGTQKQFTAGNLEITERPLDLAIDGKGFFQIALPDGTVGYTRNGEFHRANDGSVVNVDGFPLEPNLTIPEDTVALTIGQGGQVTVQTAGNPNPQQIGDVQLVNFVNPEGLQAIGDNLFRETAASGAPQQGNPGLNGLGVLRQNTLELSNVNVVEELIDMISIQRAYEMNSKVVSTADEMLQYMSQNL